MYDFYRTWMSLVSAVRFYCSHKGKKVPFDPDFLCEALSYPLIFWTPWCFRVNKKSFQFVAKDPEAVNFVLETFEKESVLNWLKTFEAFNSGRILPDLKADNYGKGNSG